MLLVNIFEKQKTNDYIEESKILYQLQSRKKVTKVLHKDGWDLG